MVMRRTLLLFALLMLCNSPAAFSKKDKDTSPLYQDPSGWQILRGIPGDRIASKISALSSEALDRLERMAPIAERRYILEHGPALFYCFVMEIPAGITTYWGAKSGLVLKYLSGKDTLQVESTRCFFTTKKPIPNKLIFTWELRDDFTLPNPLVTSDGPTSPAIYAEFPFRELPDRLLSCSVTNVRSYRKEAN